MFKNWRCLESADRPGYGYGGTGNICLRKANHKGPHRAAGFIEWDQDDPKKALRISHDNKKNTSNK